jgi:hypothetical protein
MDSNHCHKGLWLWGIKPPSYSPEVICSDYSSVLKRQETLPWTPIFKKNLKDAVSQLLEKPDKTYFSENFSF